jgi:hypothetical protein
LRAVREQSKISKCRVDEVHSLYKEIHDSLPQFNSIYAANFLDAIFTSPVFNTKSIERVSEIPHSQTVYMLVKKFVEKGLVQDLSPKRTRNKVYGFNKLLDIIDAVES